MTAQLNADNIRRRLTIVAVKDFVQTIRKAYNVQYQCKGTETLKLAVKAQRKHSVEPAAILIKISVLHNDN